MLSSTYEVDAFFYLRSWCFFKTSHNAVASLKEAQSKAGIVTINSTYKFGINFLSQVRERKPSEVCQSAKVQTVKTLSPNIPTYIHIPSIIASIKESCRIQRERSYQPIPLSRLHHPLVRFHGFGFPQTIGESLFTRERWSLSFRGAAFIRARATGCRCPTLISSRWSSWLKTVCLTPLPARTTS